MSFAMIFGEADQVENLARPNPVSERGRAIQGEVRLVWLDNRKQKRKCRSLDPETREALIYTKMFIFNICIYILIGSHVSIHS